MLCLTGLPLIFHQEIDDYLYREQTRAAPADRSEPANLDDMTRNAVAQAPGYFVQFIVWDRDVPDTLFIASGSSPIPRLG